MRLLDKLNPFTLLLIFMISDYLQTISTISKYTINTSIESYLDEKGNEIIFIIKQIEHTVTYKQWYLRDRKYYTYHVKSITIDKSTGKGDIHEGHYPHMCGKFFIGAKLGHYYARVAHIERVGLKLISKE